MKQTRCYKMHTYHTEYHACPFTHPYDRDALLFATARGYVESKHLADIESGDENAIGSSHPILWLTEEEAERWFS